MKARKWSAATFVRNLGTGDFLIPFQSLTAASKLLQIKGRISFL